MTDPRVVIATTTYYKDVNEPRAQLALKTARATRAAGYTMVIVDGSPDPRVFEWLSDIGAIVEREKESGMGNSRRQVFRKAKELVSDNDDVIIWTEPEKFTMIPLLKKLIDTLIAEDADLLVPRRESVAGYPLLQQHFEYLNNLAFRLATGLDFDHCVGTRIFKAKVASHFSKYVSKCGEDLWDIHMIPIWKIWCGGYKVIEAEVDYIHPAEQTADEDSPAKQYEMFLKRNKQLQNTINALKAEGLSV
jgi:hypothetical protein